MYPVHLQVNCVRIDLLNPFHNLDLSDVGCVLILGKKKRKKKHER